MVLGVVVALPLDVELEHALGEAVPEDLLDHESGARLAQLAALGERGRALVLLADILIRVLVLVGGGGGRDGRGGRAGLLGRLRGLGHGDLAVRRLEVAQGGWGARQYQRNARNGSGGSSRGMLAAGAGLAGDAGGAVGGGGAADTMRSAGECGRVRSAESAVARGGVRSGGRCWAAQLGRDHCWTR